MTDSIKVENTFELVEAVNTALENKTRLDVRSRGSLTKLGRTMQTQAILDLSALNRVLLYEPDELVITVEPALSLNDINSILAERGQMLAFEPPEFSALYGTDNHGGSIAGAMAINAAGPRRFKAGAARDFILGVKGVSGFGKVFAAGGRVVKNVTGYDVAKLMVGAFGTLGIMSEITLKVMPCPESENTVIYRGLDEHEALSLMQKLTSSSLEASAVAYLPTDVAHSLDTRFGETVTLVRLEGPCVSLGERVEKLRFLSEPSIAEVIEQEGSREHWRRIRNVNSLFLSTSTLWRVTCAPADIVSVIHANSSSRYFVDWAGGMLWLAQDDPPRVSNGSIMLFRRGTNASDKLAFMECQDEALMNITRRIKNSFDPHGILNPGRIFEGI